MRISACYIVRDEAEKLERSLQSIEGAVDEIIVVDTGSADATVNVAESHGASVYSFPWQDDFSAARNVSLSKATGDWILVVDADEYFPEGIGANIRHVIEQYGAEKDLLLLIRRELDEDQGIVLLDSYVPRLLRRVEGLAYEGAIHEEPRHNGAAIQRMAAVPGQDLFMMHTGYSSTLSQAKGERNLALLLKELNGGHPRDSIYMYLAETYSGLDDEENALKYAWLDVNSGRKAYAYASRSYRILLSKLAKRPESFLERRKAAMMAVKDFPELPEFHADYAECLGFGMDYRGALREAKAALALYNDKSVSGLEPTTFDRETAEFVEKRSVFWSGKVREEAAEQPLRKKAGTGDWPGLLQETEQRVYSLGTELIASLLLMELDLSEYARSVSAKAVELLPPSFLNIWNAYLKHEKLEGSEEKVFVQIIDGIMKLAGTQRAEGFIGMARDFSPVRKYETAKKIAEEEAWEMALSLLEDAEGDALLTKGICLYHLGDEDTAFRMLSEIPEQERSPEAESFLHWMKEV